MPNFGKGNDNSCWKFHPFCMVWMKVNKIQCIFKINSSQFSKNCEKLLDLDGSGWLWQPAWLHLLAETENYGMNYKTLSVIINTLNSGSLLASAMNDKDGVYLNLPRGSMV